MRPIDYFDTTTEMFGPRPAVQDAGVTMSFAELRSAADAVARSLAPLASHRNLGRVAIYSPNDHRVLMCLLAIMRVGAVATPLHLRNSAEKNVSYLRILQPSCVFYHSSVARSVEMMRRGLDRSCRWICLDATCHGDPSLLDFADENGAALADWGDVFGNSRHPVYIRQTSGSTGEPKIIVNDVGSFDATHQTLHHVLHPRAGNHARCLVAAPLSHAAGVHAFSMLTLGATLILLKDFDPVDVLKNIERHRITHLWLPASGLYLLLGACDDHPTDCSSLRSIVLGASAVAPDKLRQAVERFGPCVSVNYSQIEGGFLTWLDEAVVAEAVAGTHPERLKSSGRSLFVSRVAIMDDDGRVLPVGATGEIVVRGRSVKPYITAPFTLDDVETANAQRFGWHHTGDMGYIDDSGYLFVVGRKKNTIITGGFKVSTDEIEAALLELPEMLECAVVGAVDEERGESVKAIVVFKPGRSLDDRAIASHCRERLGSAHVPRSIERWPSLPKTAVGKNDRRKIQEMLTAGASHRSKTAKSQTEPSRRGESDL